MEYVFVYGTLRKGCSNHGLLQDAKFLGLARTREKYALYTQDIPYVVKDQAVSHIRGEVYQVDETGLGRLDILEGHPDWYAREKSAVYLDTGEKIQAWIYFFPEPHGELVQNGDFLSR